MDFSKCGRRLNICGTMHYLMEIYNGSSQGNAPGRVSVIYTGHANEPGLSCVVGDPVFCTVGH